MAITQSVTSERMWHKVQIHFQGQFYVFFFFFIYLLNFFYFTDQEILSELERERIVVFTPARYVGGKRTICYDDRYVLRLAVDLDGIVVSNDNYRDLTHESLEFKKVVEERTLMYSFVNDRYEIEIKGSLYTFDSFS